MCIRDSIYRVDRMLSTLKISGALDRVAGVVLGAFTKCEPCLLYTSDAADERSSVDLGGRRIIKKKHMCE